MSKKEYFESTEKLEKKAKELASLIEKSKHLLIFTGAGISTSTGIPDFRGPNGVWTCAKEQKEISGPITSCIEAIPSYTHMSIVELVEKGYCKYVVSQNCDGLHRRSGLDPSKLSELHGNTNLETCGKCKKEYLRDYECDRDDVDDHSTGRICSVPNCGGQLYDSIINFGENLPKIPFKKARQNSKEADLCIVLGSSLTVSPANSIAGNVGLSGRKLVIVNLQKTEDDKNCCLRVFGKTDEFMAMVMKNLKLEPKPFSLKRRIILGNEKGKNYIYGIDVDDTPCSLWKKVKVNGKLLTQEPFEWTEDNPQQTKIVLYPFGHYQEPPLEIEHDFAKKNKYILEYSPYTREWKMDNLKE